MSKLRPNEGRYSKVTRRIWNSADFRALSAPKPNAQSLFFRLLTGPEIGIIPGLYEFRVAGTAEAINWTPGSLRKCLKEITNRGMAFHDASAGLMWVPKAIVHNPPDNPNVIVGWSAAWKELPACETKERARESLREYCESRGAEWAKAFDKATGNVSQRVSHNPSANTSGNPSRKGSPQPPPQVPGNQEQEHEHEQEQEQGREGYPPQPSTASAAAGGSDPDHVSDHLADQAGELNATGDPLLVLHRLAEPFGWMSSLRASDRLSRPAMVVVELAKVAGAKRGVSWEYALELVVKRWFTDDPDRINLRFWPRHLAEDWQATAALVDAEDQTPAPEAHP